MSRTNELEALLQGDDWLLGLARSLVGDPEDAQDLVQDAYVAALERGGDARKLEPWLAGFVRLSAWRRWRKRRVERDRAQELARDATAADAVAPLELAELRQMVGALVLDLPEPRRSAVHLAHIAQLPLAEVAARLGVQKSTASHHVKRGLEDLRRRLDLEFGGERRRWAAPFAVAASGVRSATIRPAAAMAGTWAVGLLGAAAAVLLAILALGRRGPQPATPARGSGAALAEGRVAEPTRLAPARTATGAARTSVAPPAPGLRERVGEALLSLTLLGPDREPLVGARWELSAAPVRHGMRTELERAFGIPAPFEGAAGVTDGAGRLSVSFAAHPALGYRVLAHSPGHVPFESAFGAAPGDSVELGTHVLDAGVVVSGSIVDDAGDPVVGVPARVRARGASRSRGQGPEGEAPVDPATGSFEVTVAGPGHYELEVLRAGAVFPMLAGSATLEVVDDQPGALLVPVDAEVLRKILVVGSCDPRRSPVTRPDGGLGGVTATDARGEARAVEVLADAGVLIDGADAGPVRVRIEDPRFAPVDLEGLMAGDTRSVELRGNAAVVWRVNGEPLEQLEILLVTPRGATPERLLHDRHEPLVGGRLEGLVPGSYGLRLRSGDREAWGTIDDLAPGEVRVVEVTLEPARQVRGRVVQADGAPVAAAVVGLCTTGDEDARTMDEPIVLVPLGANVAGYGFVRREEIRAVVTDGAGCFEMDLPAEGVHMVHAEPTW